MHQPAINLVGDCFADITLAQTSLLGVQHIASVLRKADLFREVLATKNQISVQYDPVRFTPEQVEDALRQQLQNIDTSAAVNPTMEILIPIVYDGPDLQTVVDHLGLTPTSFIARHLATTFEVEMLGFTPGFAYLSGGPIDWDVPRRTTPRSRVEAGSIGLAAHYTGLYPLAGPGGWQIIGRTTKPLFDPSAEDPFTLHPAMQVRFVAEL